MKRRTLAIAILLATMIGACDRIIDLSRKTVDAGTDTGSPRDGIGTDGIPDDGGVDDAGGPDV